MKTSGHCKAEASEAIEDINPLERGGGGEQHTLRECKGSALWFASAFRNEVTGGKKSMEKFNKVWH